jgi:glutamine synthetase
MIKMAPKEVLDSINKNRAEIVDLNFDALEKDHNFLLRGDVFTQDMIETWLDYKRKAEVDAIRLRPHPQEFGLYFVI